MSQPNTPTLFTPLRLGDITLQHRVVMAPLTRFRANDEAVPQEVAAEYYAQRASPGGLIITEATFISEEAGGWSNIPGIWNQDQIAGWKRIVDRVHSKGGFIYLQLWALGRAADPEYLRSKGHKYVSAGNIKMNDEDPEAPEPLTREDIDRYVRNYAQAAKNAVHGAGFDGVELHSANGYLIDQFLQTNSNNRIDEFGGSVENRSRFALMILKAVTDAVGQEKTAIRFSPHGRFQSMRMSDDLMISQFTYLITRIRDLYPRFAYMHITEPRVTGAGDAEPEHVEGDLLWARRAWGERDGSPFLTAGGYTLDSAHETVDEFGGAIVFGRAFIANPDLPLRLRYNAKLNPYDRSTFYVKGPQAVKGYTDYPFSDELPAESRL